MRLAAGLGTLLLAVATPASAQDAPDCDLLPPAVSASTAYSGYSASHLCAAGQGPLWRGLPADTARVTRFVFSDGHAAFHRWVTITERPDGTAFAEVGGADTPYRREQTVHDGRRFALSPERLADVTRLADAAGAFDHAVGSWDGEEIYLHCQVLEMERVDAAGYRFSSFNIGCNRPARLMPLVDTMIALGGIERVRDGWAGR